MTWTGGVEVLRRTADAEAHARDGLLQLQSSEEEKGAPFSYAVSADCITWHRIYLLYLRLLVRLFAVPLLYLGVPRLAGPAHCIACNEIQ